jgi:plastocyanin
MSPMRARLDVRGFAAALLRGALLAAFLSAAAVAPAATGQAPNIIRIDVKNFMFAPTSMSVKAGVTVTWTNMGHRLPVQQR